MDLVPELRWPARNTRAMSVNFCDMTLFFSYDTLVGARIPGEGSFQSEERYSNTTSRHKNKDLDIAWCSKIPQKELLAKVNDHALEFFQEQLRNKFVGEF